MADETVNIGAGDTGTLIENDIAEFMVSSLFGPGSDNVITSAEGNNYVTSLFTMFGLFNSTVMIGLGLIITWTLVSGVAGAAYEGKPLGDKGGQVSLWTPMRMAYAVGMLAPIPGISLSLFQALILALILPSINSANELTSSMVSVMTGEPVSGNLSDGAQASKERVTPLVFDMLGNEFRSANASIFDLSFTANLSLEKERTGRFVNSGKKISLGTGEDSYDNYYRWDFFDIKDNNIGHFKMYCSSADEKINNGQMCDTKAVAYDRAIANNFNIAIAYRNDILDKKLSSTDLIDCPVLGGSRPPLNCYIGKVNNEANGYVSSVSDSVTQALNGDGDSKWVNEIRKMRSDVESGGFVMLGSYFTRFTELNKMINDIIKTRVSSYVDTKTASVSASKSSGSSEMKALFRGKDALISKLPISGKESVEESAGKNETVDRVPGLIEAGIFHQHLFGALGAAYLINEVMDGAEPISQLQYTGLTMINAVDTVITVMSVARLSKDILKGSADAVAAASSNFPFFGAPTTFLAKMTSGMLQATMNAGDYYFKLFGMWGDVIFKSMALLAFFLAYYLPALPAILWTLAVLGWLILVIEAIVAAPVWVAAHAMPEGEGIAGQHGRKGYMMLINILLRPSLMVVGFFLSIVLISAFSKIAMIILMNATITNQSVTDGYLDGVAGFGLFGMLMSFTGSMVVIVGTMIIIIHKSLNLVTWLPENVIKWAGGDVGSSLGEMSDERRVAALIGSVGQSRAFQPKGKGDGNDDKNGNGKKAVAGTGAPPPDPEPGSKQDGNTPSNEGEKKGQEEEPSNSGIKERATGNNAPSGKKRGE